MLYFHFTHTYLHKHKVPAPPVTPEHPLCPSSLVEWLRSNQLKGLNQQPASTADSAQFGIRSMGRSVKPLISKGWSHAAENSNFFHWDSQIRRKNASFLPKALSEHTEVASRMMPAQLRRKEPLVCTDAMAQAYMCAHHSYLSCHLRTSHRDVRHVPAAKPTPEHGATARLAPNTAQAPNPRSCTWCCGNEPEHSLGGSHCCSSWPLQRVKTQLI